MHSTARLQLLAAASLVTLLAACGGGGGGTAPAAAPPPVTITSQPRDLTVEEGQPASFTLGVSAAQQYSVEWLRNGVVVDSARSSAATATYTWPAAALDDDGASFAARITVGANSAGGTGNAFSVTSNAARLTVNLAAPAEPTGLALTVSASGSEAKLSWIDNATNETGYEVFRVVGARDVLVATESPNANVHLFTGLSPGASETFRVRAVRSVAGRTAASEVASLTATLAPNLAIPAAPTNALLAMGPNNTVVDFFWTDNADNETAYEIQQSIVDPNLTIHQVIATLPANATSHRISGLTGGNSYTFRVLALRTANGITTRSAAAAASITLPSSPQAQVLTLGPTQDNVLRVSSTDPGVTGRAYRGLPVEVGCVYVISASGNSSTCSRSLMLFDLGAVAGRTVRSATLRLQTIAAGVDFSPARDFQIGAVQQSWDPATVNGSTFLSLSTIGRITTTLSASSTITRSFDVTTIVGRWASGAQANNGFGLALNNEAIPGNLAAGTYNMFNSFASRENGLVANRPQLVIEYE